MPKKKAKYKKTRIEIWRCRGCEFEWSYRTAKCPICSSFQTLKIV